MALRVQVRSFEAVCRAVEARLGIGILPANAANSFAHAMKLRVVSADGTPATMEQIAKRTLLRILDGHIVGLIVILLKGMLTDRDIVVRAVAYGHDPGTAVTDYATGDVFMMDAATDVDEAAREMARRQLRRLPVTEGGKVVGMVSLGDLAIRTSGNADETALRGVSQPGADLQ